MTVRIGVRRRMRVAGPATRTRSGGFCYTSMTEILDWDFFKVSRTIFVFKEENYIGKAIKHFPTNDFYANTKKASPSTLRQYLYTLDQEVGSRILRYTLSLFFPKLCLTFTNLLINNLFLKGFLFQFPDSSLGLHFFGMQTIFTLHLFLKAIFKPHLRLLLI